MLHGCAIVLLCIAAAITYGVLHDQITARICVEYFTIGHPPVFDTDSPTLLGLGWGVIATWWVGAILGVPLALAARAAPAPNRTARSLLRPIARLLALMAASALLFGLLGYLLAGSGVVNLVGPLAARVPRHKHTAFIADLWAHSASYGMGFFGGIAIVIRTWRSRRQ
jgi:hypothetical protein